MVTLSLLQPVAALTLTMGAAAQEPASCFALDDTTDQLHHVDPSGLGTSAGPVGNGSHGAVAVRPDGTFLTARGNRLISDGSNLGPAGSTEIVGLALDPWSMEMDMVQRGAGGDVLSRIDPWTGDAVIGSAVTVTLGGVGATVGDVAIGPDGTLWATIHDPDGDLLVQLDRTTGAARPIGVIAVPDETTTTTTATLSTEPTSTASDPTEPPSTEPTSTELSEPAPAGTEPPATETPTEPTTDPTGTSTEPTTDPTETPTEPATDVTETPTEPATDTTETPTEATTSAIAAAALAPGVTGVEGLTVTPDGRILAGTNASATSGGTTSFGGAVLELDPLGAEAARVVAPPGDGRSFRGLTCAAGPGTNLSGTFHLRDAVDATPVPAPGRLVTLSRGGTVVQTATTAADGTYDFWLGAAGEVTVTAADAPPRMGPVTPPTHTVTAAGTDLTGLDVTFGYASIAGTVFDDLDGDGTHEAGEAALPGVPVSASITDGAFTWSGAATTDADGAYLLVDVPSGDVVLTVATSRPPGPMTTADTAGGETQTVAVPGGAQLTAQDIGYDGSADVTGTVWNDLDGGGDRDAGEPGLEGIRVVATVGGVERGEATTDGGGAYEIVDLPAGTATVSVDPDTFPPHAVATLGSVSPTLVATETSTDVDLFVQSLAVVSGRVVNDIDLPADGPDADDPGFAGVPVELHLGDPTLAGATPVDTATTAADGSYLFTGLEPGTYPTTYRVWIDPAERPAAVSPDPELPLAATVGTPGQQIGDLLVGFAAPATVTGRVFDDLDGDGRYEESSNETPFQNITVRLPDLGRSSITGPDGVFTFTGLPHGSHQLVVDGLPADATTRPALPATVVTSAGATTTQDVAVDASVTLQGVVFSDRSGDGARDAGEPGLAGVVLSITDGTDSWTTTTLADGTWTREDLPRGTYAVAVAAAAPDGVLTTAVGDQTDIDATAVGPVPVPAIGYRMGAVGGTVFGDRDGDGQHDPDEPALAGVDVGIRLADGTPVPGATGTTGTDGVYRIDELTSGDYEVVLDPASLGTAPTPAAVPVTLVAGQQVLDRHVAVDHRASIAGTVFNDLDADGVVDDGEPGLADIRVRAVPASGTAVETTTAADGTYRLSDLPPGTWTIQVVETDLPGTATPVETTGVQSSSFELGDAEHVTGVVIGYDRSGDLGGVIYNDVDGDGTRRDASATLPAEPGFGNVTVTLYDASDDVVATDTTNANGVYSVGALAPGDYRLVVSGLPAGVTDAGRPVSVTATSDRRVDVGFDLDATTAGVVYNDLDGDGTRAGDEPGLPGARVTLTHVGSGTTTTVVTGADGTYAFVDLVPGDHTVDVGGLGAIGDGTATRTEQATALAVPLDHLERRTGDRFGVEAPVQLSGRIVNDLDGDGADDDEPGLTGVVVRLLDANDDQVGDDLVVDPDTGAWAFDELAPGEWTVEVVAGVPTDARLTFGQERWTRTLAPDTSAAGLDTGYDAGASITGVVWDDLDGDGTRDAGEPGLEGIGLVATHEDGREFASSAPTSTSGTYLFRHLPPGTYVIGAIADEVPAPYVASTSPTVTVTVAVTQDATADPIGYWRPASITLTLFDDVDGDRQQDAAEPGVPGRTVQLHADVDADGQPDGSPYRTATTDADGVVTFGELSPGGYVVDPDTPASHIVTTANDPHAVTISPADAVEVAVGVQAYAPSVVVELDGPALLYGEATDELVYPFVVRNDGNIADTYDLAAAPDVPATVRIAQAATPDVPITTTPELDPGDAIALVAVVTVPTDLERGDVVTTVVSATGTTPALSGGVASGRATVRSVVTMPVIAVTIDGGEPGEGFVSPGDRVGYAIEVTNGTADDDHVADAHDLQVALGTGPEAAVVPGTIVVDGVGLPDATFPLTLSTLAAGDVARITFDVDIATPLTDGTVVTVTTTATATGNPDGDPWSATAATTDTVTSSALPDAILTASPPSGDAVDPGGTIVYTATIGNRADATDDWRGVTLLADLPDTVTVASVTLGGAAVGDPAAGVDLGDLAPDEYVTVVLTVAVDDPIPDGTVLTAVLQAVGDNAGPVVWATSHTVEVELGVELVDDRTGTGMAATSVVHHHELTNTGNVTTTFDLTATTDLPWTTTIYRESGVPDGQLDATDELVTTPLTVPPGGVPVHLLSVVEVPAGEADGTAASTTLAAFSQAEPPAISETFAVTEVVAPDLVVDIVADPPSTVVNRGQLVTYTTTVRNDGGAEATRVVLTDPTPANATFVTGSARLDGAPVADGGTNPFASGIDLGTIAAGEERHVSFQVTVAAVADGTPLISQASVAADDGRTAAGSVTQIVSASPVLDVVLSSSPPSGAAVTAGTEITYTAVVTNRGTLAATGVALRQAVPDRTAYVPGSTTLAGSAVGDTGGTSPLVAGLDLGTLATGESRTVRFRVRVADPVFDGEAIVAVATATSQQGVTATSATLRSVVDVRPAVSLTGGGSQDVARPGQAVHPHVVRNDGDVTDTFTLRSRSSNGWRVSLVRDDDGDGAWDPAREITPVTATGPLAPGGALRFFVVVEVAADAALGSADTTTVTAQSVVDPAVTASTTSQTRATAPSLELGMSATPSGDRVNPGSRVTYVIAVRNRGAAPATDVIVTSATPPGTVYVADSATRDGVRVPDGTGADGNPLAADNGGMRIASITPGGEVLVTFAVTVPETATIGGRITANATATATATAAARASKTHTVAPGPALDVVLTADPSADTATPAGTRITYTATVRNTGQEAARDVRVVADTPRDTSYVAGSARRDGTRISDGRTDPNPLSSVHGGLRIGDLAPGGAPVTLTYAVAVDDPVPADATVEHQITVTAGDATASSETLLHSVAVTPQATVTPDVEAHAVPGGSADLAHTVTNTGDVTDAFALAAVSSVGWVTAVYTDRDGDGDIGPDDVEVASTPVLAPGEATTIVVRVTVPAGTPLETQDVVRVTAASSLDPDRVGSARDTVTVVAGALRLTKTASPLSLTPGDRSTYTLTVRNVGTSPATDVVVTDAPPEGTRYVAGSTRLDDARVADVGGTTPLARGLALGTLAPGAARTATFAVETLADPGRTSIVNSATAAGTDTATARAGTVQPVSRDHGLDLTTAPEIAVRPGSTAVRPHLLSNTGLRADDVSVTGTSSLGLPVAVHLDRDGDGVLGADDPLVEDALALAPGEQVRLLVAVHYTADVPEGARDEVVLVARSGGDPRVQVTVTDVILVSDADVSITIRATPDGDVPVGARVAYEVVVTNRATTEVANVVVTVDAPAGTTYVPGSATRDGAPLADASGGDRNPLAGHAGGIDLGTLAGGATTVLGLVVEVTDAQPGETVAAVAGLRVEGREPVFSNTTRAVVVDPAGLQVLKSSDPTAVSGAGEVVTWTISVMNVGAGEARDVVLNDPPAAGTRYLPGSTTVDGRAAGDGLVEAEGLALGDLAPGGTRVVVFRTVLDVPGAVVQNVAAVRAAGSDARPLSNVAAVTVGQVLPATGAAGTRTLGGAAVLLVSGWMLLYVARPERQPLPVLRELARRTPTTRRRRTTE